MPSPSTTALPLLTSTTTPPSTATSSSSSLPPSSGLSTSMNAPLNISELPPTMQAQFSSLVQQLIRNAANAAARGCVQANLSLASDCKNTGAAPVKTLPLNIPAPATTLTQPRNCTSQPVNAQFYHSASHQVATTQLLNVPLYQAANQRANNTEVESTAVHNNAAWAGHFHHACANGCLWSPTCYTAGQQYSSHYAAGESYSPCPTTQQLSAASTLPNLRCSG